jgi:CRP-like cAMP-binding protein
VRVEKTEKDGKVSVIGYMNAGQMFGEMSILTGGKTTARIVADSPSVQIDSADIRFMNTLFKTEPGMQKRFFHFVALALSRKLRALGQRKEVTNDPVKRDNTQESTQREQDKLYVEMFNLERKDEVLVQGKYHFVYGNSVSDDPRELPYNLAIL